MTRPVIPSINIAPFINGSTTNKRHVATEIGNACEQIGFFTITGHGVPVELINKTYAVAEEFFDLPLAAKMQAQTVSGCGYIPLQAESLAATLGAVTPGDLKETFNISSRLTQNIWPDSLTILEPAAMTYFQALERVAATVMRIFAVALALPECYFDGMIDPPNAVLRLANYPEQRHTPLPGQLRAGEHTDYGCLTIVWPDTAPGGLQVCNRDGIWVDVVTPPASFVINIGDMMQRWTNDRWRSTLHRVANPPQLQQSRRKSMVFFHNPNDGCVISCFESCCNAANPSKYPPILAGQHRKLKSRKSRQACDLVQIEEVIAER
jgi:isopenicillin N synthase-like dioxygenase